MSYFKTLDADLKECFSREDFAYSRALAEIRIRNSAHRLLEVCERLRDDPDLDDATAVQLLNEVIAEARGL